LLCLKKEVEPAKKREIGHTAQKRPALVDVDSVPFAPVFHFSAVNVTATNFLLYPQDGLL
jgi:hypothetical protein